MNAPETPQLDLDTPRLLDLFVRRGLSEFCAELPEYQHLLPLLELPIERGLLQAVSADWPSLCHWLRSHLPAQSDRAGRFISDFRLTLPETFLLALLGSIESDHHVTLVISELQLPERDARPAQHLLQSLLSRLFTDRAPLDLLNHPLVELGAIRMQGDAPLPLRHLALDERLWRLLRGQVAALPGSRRLPSPDENMIPAAIRDSVPRLAELIRDGRLEGVIVRGDRDTARLVAAQLGQTLQRQAVHIDAAQWNTQPVTALYFHYADWLPVFEPVLGPGERLPINNNFQLPVIVLLGRDGSVEYSGLAEIDLPNLAQAERKAMLERVAGTESALTPAVLSARLQGPALQATWIRAQQLARQQQESPSTRHWSQARWMINPDRLRRLAEPVTRQVGAEAMILPPALEDALDGLLQRCQRREALWQGLGPTLQAASNPGVRSLFVGESGTGKTLAASYMATALATPLFRVDLSSVVNKYIGETEKNLGALLDEAAESDIILLFDEADAVFGQRSDGGETGERYANMLTNFLLSRIEEHPGIVILTSNARTRIDPAFIRRLDVILEFPRPGYRERLRLWRSHLGSRSPGDDVCQQLASHCDLAGGHIRNAVLSAAARSNTISPCVLIDALAAEYHKLGQSLPVDLQQWREQLTE